MAQYRNIQDVPLILVGTQGIRKFFNSFPVIVCLNPFSPVMFRLKTFLLSEDRFQYKGAAHSKLTRPAWWYLILWIISAWHRGVLRSLTALKRSNELQSGKHTLGLRAVWWSCPFFVPHPSWLQTQWGLEKNLFAQFVFCTEAFSGPSSLLLYPLSPLKPQMLNLIPVLSISTILHGNKW